MIVHICPKQDWETAKEEGEYRAPSLEEDGFIHSSRPEQILGVANRYYQGTAGLVLLWIAPQLVRPEILWEAADGEIFPHIYGPLNLDAVVSVHDFTPDEDGTFRVVPGR